MADANSSNNTFDKQAFAQALRANALPPYGTGRCAAYVRKALDAAGLDTRYAPVPAKNYGSFLRSLGFITVSKQNYTAQTGDIVVVTSIAHHPYGHVEGWDGKNWISDFIQTSLYPSHTYEKQKAAYEIYRR